MYRTQCAPYLEKWSKYDIASKLTSQNTGNVSTLISSLLLMVSNKTDLTLTLVTRTVSKQVHFCPICVSCIKQPAGAIVDTMQCSFSLYLAQLFSAINYQGIMCLNFIININILINSLDNISERERRQNSEVKFFFFKIVTELGWKKSAETPKQQSSISSSPRKIYKCEVQ